MKRKIWWIALFAAVLSLSACSGKKKQEEEDKAYYESVIEEMERELTGEKSTEKKTEAETTAPETTEQPETSEAETETEAETTEAVSEETVTEAAETEATETEAETSAGMRPEFKEAMDAYEAFYQEYCEFMKKYQENPMDLTLLAGYADMITKEQEMTSALDKWKSDDMNDAEMKYYIEVTARIEKMMIDVMN